MGSKEVNTLNFLTGFNMKKISVSDLLTNTAYEAKRTAFRQSIIEHKKTRRVQIGPKMMLHFEDYMVMRYQVQELIRAEKLTEKKDIAQELSAYNPLIPDGTNLKVTMMLEYPNPEERQHRLKELIGIEELISIEIEGHDKVYPIANEDLPRSTDDKTSAVHFLRFEFNANAIDSAKNGSNWYIHSEHLSYQHTRGPIEPNITQSLARDFS